MANKDLWFSVIIPTHNNKDTVNAAIRSACEQTYPRKHVIVVDDHSDDGTVDEVASIFDVDVAMFLRERHFNGGARNMGIRHHLCRDSDYTLFLDADDLFASPHVFQKLAEFIEENHRPDMVRLPYVRVEPDGNIIDQTPRLLAEKNIANVSHNCRVACWTKAIKTELLQLFPEGTLMEDVCQHLKQCDITETVAWFPEPFVEWHIRRNSTSNSYSAEWKASAYRFPYDLYTLDLKKQYTRDRRDIKLKEALKNLSEGKFLQ